MTKIKKIRTIKKSKKRIKGDGRSSPTKQSPERN